MSYSIKLRIKNTSICYLSAMSFIQKPLHVINASAGSGKTYHLVKEYLKLILEENQQASTFKSILAMTFTNKAAFEMKERIILALDQIGHPKFHKNKGEQLLHTLCHETSLKHEEIIEKCRNVLRDILHQYEDLSIMTIDRFNLKLIKAFSRDLDLPTDFEVSFNSDEVLGTVVDELISKLGSKEHAEINELIVKYARSKIEDGNRWNIKSDLVKFSKIIEDERNKKGVETLLKQSFTSEQFEDISRTLNSIRDMLVSKYKKIIPVLESLDPKSIPGGNRTIDALLRRANQNTFPTDEIFTSGILKNLTEPVKKEFPRELSELMFDILDYWTDNLKRYAALIDFRKNYFNMALLKFIALELHAIRKNERIVRISEFNELIGKLIQDEEAPFIYERLGNKYQHFLLDEFQDTSFMQWRNLIPLIHNSLANGNLNLIVGDAKQSIYRFKNGLAEQFVELPGIYNPDNDSKIALESSFFQSMGIKYELDSNWRSSPVIVNFNNAFFTEFREHLSEKGKNFYNAILQKPRRELEGSIKIISDPLELTTEETIAELINIIEECIQEGFSPSDICILGPTNKLCSLWALNLTKAGYKVVSSDSLLIDSDRTVKLLISYLKLRQNPAGETQKKQFAADYLEVKSGVSLYTDYYDPEVEDKSNRFDFNRFVTDHFTDQHALNSNYESLYDLTQQFIQLIQLEELNNSYVHHFSDTIYEYEQINGPDLSGFLEFYQSNKGKLAVQVPESDDALKIMTFHKSKGLEFPVVIIPTTSIKESSGKEFIYEHEDLLIYKKPGAKEIIPEAAAIYQEENDQTFIDIVNSIYVGMTRPEERLVVLNHGHSSSFAQTFHQVLMKMEGVVFEDDRLLLNINPAIRSKHNSSKKTENYVPHSVKDLLWFPDIALQDKGELTEETLLDDERQYGIQFHSLIADLPLPFTESDIQRVLQTKIAVGEISDAFQERLRSDVKRMMTNHELLQLISESSKDYSELSLLIENGNEVRPDRVILKGEQTLVIDFKTGKQNQSKHLKQVQSYCNLLSEMNFKNVSGFLYYTDNHELLAV